MGQLIKLQDYVSRYEQNIYLYPSRFIRLKKQQWDKLKMGWEKGDSTFFQQHTHQDQESSFWFEEEKQPLRDKLKGLLKFGRTEKNNQTLFETEQKQREIVLTVEEEDIDFKTSFTSRPETLEDLKCQFLDEIFRFQMKWASTIITEKSFIDKSFYDDERLKYFLQRFPDTFLVLYHPLLLIKKAPVELETIIISPTGVWCISFLEEEDLSVFIGSKERFWLKRVNGTEKKVLNPVIALNRTGKIVQQILQLNEINLPVYKAVICRNGYIDYPASPFDIQIIEKRNYHAWFNSMRNLRSPLKHNQLIGAQAILQYCQTISVRRHEWELTDETKHPYLD